MPRTIGQRLFFTSIGVFFMVIVMALFNKSLVAGRFQWEFFKQLPLAFCQRAPLAFILQFFFVQKFAGNMSAKYPTDNRLVSYVIRTGFTVLIMCPIMSFYSNIIYVGFTADLIPIWLTKMVQNWPFAFFVQVFLLGPWNRFLFSLVFKENEKSSLSAA